MDFCYRFRMSLELHSDQGKNVDGGLIREICDLTGIRKTHAAAHHHVGNAITERENATIKNVLRAYCSEKRDDWDEHLGPFMMAYRSMVHSTLNETPNMIMLGRQVCVPINALLSTPLEEHNQKLKMPASTYAASLITKLSRTMLTDGCGTRGVSMTATLTNCPSIRVKQCGCAHTLLPWTSPGMAHILYYTE